MRSSSDAEAPLQALAFRLGYTSTIAEQALQVFQVHTHNRPKGCHMKKPQASLYASHPTRVPDFLVLLRLAC